jgi:hypothetical protein
MTTLTNVINNDDHHRNQEITDLLCEIRDRQMRKLSIQWDEQFAKAL